MEKVTAFLAALPFIFAAGLKAGIVFGLIGSLIEEIGKRFGLPRAVAVGQQIEAIAVDVPKIVTRIQDLDLPGLVLKVLSLFGKAKLPLVLLCLGLAGSASLTGCAALKPAVSAASVPQDVALAYKAAGVALAVADTVTAAYIDSLAAPTDKQLADAEAVVDVLQSIKDKLDSAKADLANGREKLRAAVDDLQKAQALLSALGVKVPAAFSNALGDLKGVLS